MQEPVLPAATAHLGAAGMLSERMTTLAQFADELAELAADIGNQRLHAALRNIIERMRREASVKPNAKPTSCGGSLIFRNGPVLVQRKRRRGINARSDH